jgi:hypothetical protein
LEDKSTSKKKDEEENKRDDGWVGDINLRQNIKKETADEEVTRDE